MGKAETLERYRALNLTAPRGGIVFAGSSLMEQFPIERFAKEDGIAVLNRGISGYVTQELLENLDTCVLDLQPSRLFINIGTNDLSQAECSPTDLIERYAVILRRIRDALPETEIYVMAYYPVNPDATSDSMKEVLRIRSNEKINSTNALLPALAKSFGARFIDINAPLKDALGRLKAEYTVEGMHINEQGYRAVYPLLKQYLTSN